MKPTLLLTFFIGIFFSFTAIAQVPQSERNALVAFYNATGGPNWTNSQNWNSTQAVSTWFGITVTNVSGQDRVTGIQLSENNILGSVGSTLNDLTFLTTINVANNDINGNLDLTNLFRLSVLNVSDNNIGSIQLNPSNVTDLGSAYTFKNNEELEYIEIPVALANTLAVNLPILNIDIGLDFTQNISQAPPMITAERAALKDLFATNYTGSLSGKKYADLHTAYGSSSSGITYSTVSDNRRVTGIQLSDFVLSGELVALNDFSELKTLDVHSNSLTSVPESLGQLSELIFLDMSFNGSITTLPVDLSGLSSLETWNMSNCRIDLLPTSPNVSSPTSGIGVLSALKVLNFSNNDITLLPEELGVLTGLTSLIAAPNPFPSVPSEYSNLVNLTTLDLSGAQITNIPAGFSGLINLKQLYLNNNNLQIIFEGGIGNLTALEELRLHTNKLTSLPNDIGNLGNTLQDITLYNNAFTGLPVSFGNLLSLTSLDLSSNLLTSLPNTIGNLTELTALDLGNRFRGGNELTTLPSSIGNLLKLEKLLLYNNRLEVLPASINNLTALVELDLESQKYDSTINGYPLKQLPSDLSGLTNLRTFKASYTGLESLPASFRSLSQITDLTLQFNEISGVLDLGLMTDLTNIDLSNNRISGLKIAVPFSNFNFSSGAFSVGENPNLNCIEVNSADLPDWKVWEEQNITGSSRFIDNGVIFSDNCSGNNNIPLAERNALIDIYNEFRLDENTIWRNWSDDLSNTSNAGSWVGVTVAYINGQKHVTELNLGVINSLRGKEGDMPESFGNFSELQKFSIGASGSNIPRVKTFPSSIGNLDKLVDFQIIFNSSLEALPPEIGDLDALENLFLFYPGSELNTIPDEIGNLTSLKELTIIGTKISLLPETLGNITTLERISVEQNQLETLPQSIGNLSSLTDLNFNSQYDSDLQERSMVTLPVTLNNLSNLKNLNGYSNKILESIDDNGNRYAQIDLSNLINLITLQIYDNKIRGLKLGVPFSALSSSNRSSFSAIDNPNLSCVEVNTGDLSGWQTNQLAIASVDDGVIYSDNCPVNNLPQIEREALIAIYNNLEGDSSWTNWDTDPNSRGNVGSWRGVTTAFINNVQHVTGVEINWFRQSGLGAVPDEVGDLTELKTLAFSGSSFSSNVQIGITSLPESISQLQKLETLNLSSNKLLEVLPDAIGSLSSLKTFSLSQSPLLIDLPNTLSGLTSLEDISISSVPITTLPSSLGSIVNLKRISINSTSLATLPATIGNLKSLETLQLSSNELEALPDEIGGLTALKTASLSVNKLISLPSTIGNWDAIESIDVYQNELVGLPDELNRLTTLRDLIAYNNDIAGVINLDNIPNLRSLNLSGNLIEGLKIEQGPFDFSFSSSSFDLRDNPYLTCVEVPTDSVEDWKTSGRIGTNGVTDSGVIVSDACSGTYVPNIERLALIAFYESTRGGDTWTGRYWNTDPSDLTNVGSWEGVTTDIINGQKHVTRLETNFNVNIDGPMPQEIGNLSELKYLFISEGITAIPTEIGSLQNLETFYLRNATITQIPESIGGLTSLKSMTIRESDLIEIPSSMGNLTALETLDFSNNKIDLLPESIGNLERLKTLTFRNNYISQIPTSINNLKQLTSLDFYNNKISGDLDFSGLEILNNLSLEVNNISTLRLNLAVTSFGVDGRSFRISSNPSFSCLQVPTDELVSWQLQFVIPNGAAITDNCGAPEQQDRSALVALYNTTTGGGWEDRTNWLNPDVSVDNWVGVSTTNNRLASLELPDNNLNGYIPKSWESTSDLQLFNVSNNTLHGEIPNFNASGASPEVIVVNNKYNIDELENAVGTYGIDLKYQPQSFVQSDKTISVQPGGSVAISVNDVLDYDLNLERSFLAPNNIYMWYKNGILIPDQTQATISLSNLAVQDTGSYYCIITNTILTDLTITTASTSFTVSDNEAPVVVTQNVTLALDQNGTATLTSEMVDNGTTDNAGADNLSYTLDVTSFSCSNVGTPTTVTLTVQDASGNQNTGTAVVTVIDNLPPTITVTDPDIIYSTSSSEMVIDPTTFGATATDNCEVTSFALSETTFPGCTEGDFVIILTAIDTNGNSTQEEVTILFADDVAPTVLTQDITVTLDANGDAVITPEQIDNGSSDNCTLDFLELDVTTFTCDNLGANTVTLTAFDQNGFSDFANATVTVLDETAPIITDCPTENIEETVDAGTAFEVPEYSASFAATDSCDSQPVITQTPAAGTLIQIGSSATINVTATDASGNASTCSFFVVVTETLGTSDLNLANAITLYPVPAASKLHIDSTIAFDTVEIIDILGRKVAQPDNTQKTVDVTELPDGTYFLQFSYSGQTITKRFIKQSK